LAERLGLAVHGTSLRATGNESGKKLACLRLRRKDPYTRLSTAIKNTVPHRHHSTTVVLALPSRLITFRPLSTARRDQHSLLINHTSPRKFFRSDTVFPLQEPSRHSVLLVLSRHPVWISAEPFTHVLAWLARRSGTHRWSLKRIWRPGGSTSPVLRIFSELEA
jgi:hypothetical protein